MALLSGIAGARQLEKIWRDRDNITVWSILINPSDMNWRLRLETLHKIYSFMFISVLIHQNVLYGLSSLKETDFDFFRFESPPSLALKLFASRSH